MICLEIKEEANTAIQDLNETTRYIAKEYDNQDKIHINTAEEKEQKSNLLNTVTTEHIAQQHNQQIDQNKVRSKELTI